MSRRIRVLLITVLLALIVALWLRSSGRKEMQSSPNQTIDVRKSVQSHGIGDSVATNSEMLPPRSVANQVARASGELTELANSKSEWRTPIEFYGLVLDENTNPVADADIHFDWTDLSVGGSSDKDTASDTSGRFSLKNVRGKHLMVKVSKNGYYAYQPFGMGFFYAGENQNFTPDVNNPVIFRLKRKGIAEPLVVFDKDFQLSISGKPLELNLRTGQMVSTGQGNVVFNFMRTPNGQTTGRTYDWSFTIAVPNGGLVASSDEFAFLAPESGYLSSDTVEMKSAPEEAWESRIRRAYFVKLPDGIFARVELDLMAHNGSLRMQTFVNPSGSRNLEFDPNKEVQPSQ